MEVIIHLGYIIEDNTGNSKNADQLYLEFTEKFKQIFPDAKLSHTFIQKINSTENPNP